MIDSICTEDIKGTQNRNVKIYIDMDSLLSYSYKTVTIKHAQQ